MKEPHRVHIDRLVVRADGKGDLHQALAARLRAMPEAEPGSLPTAALSAEITARIARAIQGGRR
jgi:hypothetical protein